MPSEQFLLPCPFCGAKMDPEISVTGRCDGVVTIRCGCGIETRGFYTVEAATQFWNRRTEVLGDSWPLPGSAYEEIAALYNTDLPAAEGSAAAPAEPYVDVSPCIAGRTLPIPARQDYAVHVRDHGGEVKVSFCVWPGRHMDVGALKRGDFPLPEEINPETLFEELHLVSAARHGCTPQVLTLGQIEALLAKGATLC